jgi:hypothetical protein
MPPLVRPWVCPSTGSGVTQKADSGLLDVRQGLGSARERFLAAVPTTRDYRRKEPLRSEGISKYDLILDRIESLVAGRHRPHSPCVRLSSA